MDTRLRIVIADDDPSVRSAIAILIRGQLDMDVVGEASDLVALLYETKCKCPDLIIVDWDALSSRTNVLLNLLELFPCPPGIIGLGTRRKEQDIVLKHGIGAFACIEEPPERLLAVIREVAKTRESTSVEALHQSEVS